MLCQECPSRSICQSECPELALHLKEIEGSQREMPISNPRHGKVPWASSVYLTKKEKVIITLLGMGLPRKSVCESLNITRDNLRFRLSILKKKHVGI